IANPAVRRVNFTGSTRVGRLVAEAAARHLKPALVELGGNAAVLPPEAPALLLKRALLELGGKAPFIVLDDADLDEAVKAAAFGAFMNQGQICMATERIVVDAAIAESFVEKFKAKVATLATGNPRAGKTPLGAVVDLKTVGHVDALVADALKSGAVQVN